MKLTPAQREEMANVVTQRLAEANARPSAHAMADFTCSFCGRQRTQVQKLVPGPRLLICDSCVLLCIRTTLSTPHPIKHGTAVPIVSPGRGAAFIDDAPGFCGFCGESLESTRVFFQCDHDRSICGRCVAACASILADGLGQEWSERHHQWIEWLERR